MCRKASPWIGVLFFLGLVRVALAVEVPREILIEVNNPVLLQTGETGVHTGLPDLDAFLSQYPRLEMRYALAIPLEKHPGMKKYLLLRLASEQSGQVARFMEQLSKLASVRWARPNNALRVHFLPNDPLFGDQWGLIRTGAEAAWDIGKGSPTIPIAIIDTGCEMDHPDLVNSIWSNPAEVGGLEGVDDDSNGYVDDSHGWDFVDAPTFPSGGDFLVRDNDPSDEMGHGTAMAGIIAATINNNLGVAGLAPDCPLMILRAGNMDGYLQEDDVASALLYALDNGARLVNMSFGDTQASPMMGDVVNYAAQGGLLMVAAAGNYGNSATVYPAGFGPTMCVGASTENDARASFSSYGTALDLVAPGTNIVSTLMEGQYGAFQGGNGTSFATAFASAAAGMILSEHPDWDPAAVISVLKSTTDDVEPEGWDVETGQGILRADRALAVNEALVAEISLPLMAQGFAEAETLDVIGTASGVYIQDYKVYTGTGENPAEWELIAENGGVQILNDLLTSWRNYEPLDTAYTIRLDVTDIFGNTVDDRVVVYFDPSPPVISDISLVPILDADRPSYLLNFTTDDLTTGRVWLLSQTGPFARWVSLSLNYQAAEHTLLIGGDLGPEEYEYYIWVQNSTGLADSTAILGTIDLRQESLATNNFVEQPATGIPPGYLYEYSTDLDEDGFLEVWEDTLDANGSKSDLRVWEATASWGFADLGLDFGLEIPKSIGDSDADGLAELLTLYAGASNIFEATNDSGLPQPNNLVWSDSGDVWGARFMDFDSTDGHGEVLLVSGGMYKIYANDGSGTLNFIQDLPDPFSDLPTFLPPYCRINDFDDDGKPELLFGDYDGNLFIYERQTDGSFDLTWLDSLDLLDTGEFLSDGDYDGDGQIEFAALAHTQTVLAGEHLADTRYWALYIYKNSADNQFAQVDTLYFFGAENPSDFASGISAGDVYGDADAEILLCVYPDFYVVAWDSLAQEYGVIWYYSECRSNKAVVGDFNRNGHHEILFNSGQSTRVFEAVGDWSYWPPPPLGFEATPEPDRVNLRWAPVAGADAYNLYRGGSSTNLTWLAEVPDPDSNYTDFSVVLDSTYYYALATVNLASPTPEGPITVPIMATPNTPPYVVGDTAHFVSPNFVSVDFNEPMGGSILDPNNYWIAPNNIRPNSAVTDAGGTRAVLAFEATFQDTTYRLIIHELFDLQGSPLSTLDDTLYFDVASVSHDLPYVVAAATNADRSNITVFFSQNMLQTQMATKTNYTITSDPVSMVNIPQPINILSAEANTANSATLEIDPKTPLGALGIVYRIEANNIHSTGGLEIDTTHNTTTLNFFEESLDHVFVYPNPYSKGEGYMVFSNLTQDAEIRILTLQGVLVKTLKTSSNVSGGLPWYLDNERGEPVASGTYFYYVSTNGDTFWGKLAVVR